MHTVKEEINRQNGFHFLMENLEFCSPLGRKNLFCRSFQTDPTKLADILNLQDEVCHFVDKYKESQTLARLIEQLCQLNDISKTIDSLGNGTVLDDIQLFEIKKFCLISWRVSTILLDNGFDCLHFHDLAIVIDALDPEHNRLPHFYIYSSYQAELEAVRKQINETADEELLVQLKWQESQIEDEIRKSLSKKIAYKQVQMQENLNQLGLLDLLLAHAQQILRWHLCKPNISSNACSSYTELFNPLVQESTGKFQPIDITLDGSPTLITGANMSGKTVLLKTLGLAQTLCQFGFYVPASSASVSLVDSIIFSIGDKQSELNGLSSFAVEILNINKIIKAVKGGQKVLALVDELARTTNPDEGKALVISFVKLMQNYQTNALITTHYSGLGLQCRRLRVKGLTISGKEQAVTPENINQFMDYSLLETEQDDVPNEAIKIAEIFGVDQEFLLSAKQTLTSDN